MILIKYFYSQVLNEFFCRITHQKIVRKVIRFRTVGAPRNLEKFGNNLHDIYLAVFMKSMDFEEIINFVELCAVSSLV